MISIRMLCLYVAVLLLAACASVAERYAGAEALYSNGDYAAAFPQFQKLAAQGDVGAERYLGYMYWNGLGTIADYAKSIQWYTAAADTGDARAEASLGDIYYSGAPGFPQDWQKADYWTRRAAVQGNSRAESHLGVAYMLGRGVPVDYVTARTWLTEAVDGDDDDGSAEAALGSLYQMGWGVPQDFGTGKDWFDKAAEKQNRAALLYIGTLYHYGALGYPKDEAQSDHYYQLAAAVPVKSLIEMEVVMKSIIDLHKVYPAEALPDHESGQATVEFDLPGEIPENIRVTRTSGHEALDKAAMLAVQRSLFPAKPSSMAGVTHFVISVDFENHLTAPTPAPAAASAQ